jgi:hypothetical protein
LVFVFSLAGDRTAETYSNILNRSRNEEALSLQQQPSPYLLLKLENTAVSVRVSPQDGKAEAQAVLTISNPSSQTIPRLTLRIGDLAEVTAVTVDGQAVQPTSSKDERTRLVSLGFNFPTPLGARATTKVTVSYTLKTEEATSRAALVPDECSLIPDSGWTPMIHTSYQVEYNADTAPFTLAVTVPSSMMAVSSGERGAEKTEGAERTYVFEEKGFSQPLFIARDFESVGSGSNVEFYLPRGYVQTNRETLERLRSEIAKIQEFYTAFFGGPVQRTVRVAASGEVPAYGVPGLLILDERVFARNLVDEDTIFFLAVALARAWIGGRVLVQGIGHAILYDGLPSYSAMLYLENRFGKPGLERAVERFRRGYSSLVTGGSAYDAPLVRQTLLNREYFTSVYNKVPFVMRLIESKIGRERLHGIIKTLLSPPGRAVTFDEFQTALAGAVGAAAWKPILDQWFSDVVMPDFAIGKPVEENGRWTAQVANFGTGDATIDVEATSGTGERTRQQVKVEPQGYAQAVFTTRGEPATVTVDPDHLYLQTDYTNDSWPRKPPVDRLISQGTIALSRGNQQEAEARLREAVAADPENSVARASLARVLTQTGKAAEAERNALEVLKQEPLTLVVYSLAHTALGEVAMARNQAAQAVEHFRQASLAQAEDNSMVAARDALIRAERAANKLPTADKSAQEFISHLDSTVGSGRPAAVREIVTQQNLKRFIASISVLKGWKTEVLRAENLDQNRVIVDARVLATTGNNVERATRAVYVLRRRGSGWMLDDIPVFLER